MDFSHKTSPRTAKSSKRRGCKSFSFIGSSYARRLQVEALEDRRMLAAFSVTNLLDGPIAVAGTLPGSLRQAIFDANTSAGPDTITFDPAVFTGGNASLIRLTAGELVITDTLTLDGSAATGVTITGDADDNDITDAAQITNVAASGAALLSDNSRVLNFSNTSGDLTLEGLTLTGGRTTADNAGGAGVQFNSSGQLSLTRSSVSGNSTAGNVSSGGGGIWTLSGAVTLTNSTLSGNSTAGQFANGGGGISTKSGAITLISSTVSGNSTVSIVLAVGGGIYTNSGAVTLTSSTVTGNFAQGAGAGIFVRDTGANPAMTIENSIVAGNTSGVSSFDLSTDPQGSLTVTDSLIGNNVGTSLVEAQAADADGNLIGSAAGGGILNPLLGPLTDNGGPTATHAPLPGSPVINAGASTEPFDQRGLPRNFQGVDMGAVELQVHIRLVDTSVDENDGNYSVGDLSLREAIAQANASPGPDTIAFDPAVFTGGNASLIRLTAGQLVVTDTLTIDGSTGVDVTITGDASGNDITGADHITDVAASTGLMNDNSRVLYATASTGDLTLDGLTLTGGRTSVEYHHGGGILFSSGGQLTLIHTEVSGNSVAADGTRGGGIYTVSDVITLISSTLSGNRTEGIYAGGGGIYTNSSSISLTGSTVRGNSTEGRYSDGGGIDATFGDVTLVGSTISGNRTTGFRSHGGGLFSNLGAVTLTNSTVSDNSTAGYTTRFTYSSAGGGIATWSGSVTLTGSTVSGNSTAGMLGRGGGISTRSGAVSLTRSTVSGNRTSGVRSEGGGISTGSGAVTLVHSTVSGNSTSGADAHGGGIQAVGAVSLFSSTVSKNSSAGLGGGVFVRNNFTIENSIVAENTDKGTSPDLNFASGTLVVSHSLIGDNRGTPLVESQSADVSGNLIGSSLGGGTIDPLLLPLANYGGLSETHALLPGSPALDVGASAELYDQRGGPYFFRNDGNGVDMGAYELQALPTLLVVDTATDENDGDYTVGDLSLREAVAIANGSSGANTIIFDPLVFSGGSASLIRLTAGELVVTEPLTIAGLTGTGVTITGDANDDDVTSAAHITNVAASYGGTPGAPDDLLDDNSRLFHFTAALGNLTLDGLTLTGGRTTAFGEDGAGVRFDSSGQLTLGGSTVSGNSTAGGKADGGGIRTNSGAVTLVNSTVSGNSTTGGKADGGGIRTNSGAVTLVNSTVSGNSTTGDFSYGGGIATRLGAVVLSSSTVSGNRTAGEGSYGGGLYAYLGAVTLTSSTVSGNSTTGLSAHGGGLFTYAGEVTLSSSTVSNNSTAGVGGGVFVYDSGVNPSVSIQHSIVAGNSDNATAPDLRTDPNGVLTTSHSLIGDKTGNALVESQSADAAGNLIGSSSGAGLINPLLGPLANHGGPTKTHALLPGSPAINAGDPSEVFDPALFDQRGPGFARVQFDRIDIGAFEYDTVNLPFVGLVVDTTLDHFNGDYSAGDLSLRETVALANASLGPNTISFDPAVFTGGSASLIRLTAGALVVTDTLTIDGSTGTGVMITGDANDDDVTNQAHVTDVAASYGGTPGAADDLLDDNGRVLHFTAATGDLTLEGLSLTGGRTTADDQEGGGVRFDSSGQLTITRATVSGNSTSGLEAEGGGVYADSGTVILASSTVSGNHTSGNFARGGGLATGSGTVTLASSTVSGNSTGGAGGNGAGVATWSGAITATNSTVSGNSAAGLFAHGGGLSTYSGAVALASSTVSDNSAAGTGGGVYVEDTGENPFFSLENTIVMGNASGGAAADLRPDPQGVVTLSHSLIGDNAGTALIEAQTVDANGNLIGSSLGGGIIDPLLGPLTDNGGPTATHALLPGSPALNAGLSAESFDQRGFPFLRDNGDGVDMGALERQSLTLWVDTTADEYDGDYSAGDLSLREAIALANIDAGPDTIVFDPAVFTGGNASLIRLTDGELIITGTLTIDGSTGTGVTITGDANDDDTTDAEHITDVSNFYRMSENSRVLNFTASSGDLMLEGLTLTGGNGFDGAISEHGGGIRFSSSGQLNLVSTRVSGNGASWHIDGGGLWASSGAVTLVDSMVSGNSTNSNGGGIATDTGAVTLINSTVSDNSISGEFGYFPSGGGISTKSGAITLVSSTVSGNSNTGFYGYSTARGGGIATGSGAVTLTSSTVSGNSVSAYDRTYSQSGYGGGGYVTISSGSGGGISVSTSSVNAPVIITNSIVSGNHANSSGPDLRLITSSSLTITHSLIGDNASTSLVESQTPDGNGNLIGSRAGSGRINPLLGPLADNGGPTETHALLAGSPAINAGASTEPFDQRGLPRNVNGADMGAFEVQTALWADFDLDGDVDGGDFLAWQRGLSPQPLSTADLALWQAGYGQTTAAVPPLAAVVTTESEAETVALMVAERSVQEPAEQTLVDPAAKADEPAPQPLSSRALLLDAAMVYATEAEQDAFDSPLADEAMAAFALGEVSWLDAEHALLKGGRALAYGNAGRADNDSQHDDLAEKREADARGASLSWLSDALVERVFG